jgi:hypothetical protein
MFDYDKGSKWLIQHHGDAILRLAGIRGIVSWKPLQAEPVHPRRLPDGLIEVRRRGKPRPVLFALEVSTYPYRRLAKLAADDALLIYLERGSVPEVVAMALRPLGKGPVPHERVVRSEEGTTRIHVQWKVLELWKIPVVDLLAAGDVGLIPLVPLAHFDGPLEPILLECRERIERDAPPEERENLRVVTHLLAGLKYNDPRLFQKLGGQKAVLKTGSPLLREIVEEETRKARREGEREGSREMAEKAVITVLMARFGPEAEFLKGGLGGLGDDQLNELLGLAGTCSDLASFREHLPPAKCKRKR